MSFLGKKEKKRVSKMITAKLLTMGVKDEIMLTGSGKFSDFWQKGSDGNLILGEDKKPKVFKKEMPIAMNILRHTLKELLNQDVDTINAFLNMPIQPVTKE